MAHAWRSRRWAPGHRAVGEPRAPWRGDTNDHRPRSTSPGASCRAGVRWRRHGRPGSGPDRRSRRPASSQHRPVVPPTVVRAAAVLVRPRRSSAGESPGEPTGELDADRDQADRHGPGSSLGGLGGWVHGVVAQRATTLETEPPSCWTRSGQPDTPAGATNRARTARDPTVPGARTPGRNRGHDPPSRSDRPARRWA